MNFPQLFNRAHRQARNGARIGQVVPSIAGGSFGGNITGRNGPYGANQQQGGIDFAREAGNRFDISVVFAVLAFAQRNMQAVPMHVYRLDKQGHVEMVPDHPIAALLKRPNPWYPGLMMQGLSVFAEMGWGSSYCYKHRDRWSRIRALEFLPVGTCYPYTWPGTGEFISLYWVTTPSGFYQVNPEDILHIRYALNGFWTQYGKSPLEALFPEIAADRMASRHEAALLDNQGVSSAIISPKQLPRSGDELEPILEFTDNQAIDLEARLRERLTRDAKGSMFVANAPIDVNPLSWDPKSLDCNVTHGLAEERVCACFGFQPGAVGFGTGLREQNNRASIQSAIEFSIDQGLVPYMQARAEQITMYLEGEVTIDMGMLMPGEYVMYDFGAMPAIKRQLLREMTEAAGGPIISPNEARMILGREPVKDGDDIRMTSSETDEHEGDPIDSQNRRNGKLNGKQTAGKN